MISNKTWSILHFYIKYLLYNILNDIDLIVSNNLSLDFMNDNSWIMFIFIRLEQIAYQLMISFLLSNHQRVEFFVSLTSDWRFNCWLFQKKVGLIERLSGSCQDEYRLTSLLSFLKWNRNWSKYTWWFVDINTPLNIIYIGKKNITMCFVITTRLAFKFLSLRRKLVITNWFCILLY